MIYWPAKAPGAILDFTFDFSQFLQDGETVSGKTVTASGAIVNSSAIIGGNQVQVWLSAGVLGTPGVVSCSITTSQARTDAETGIVPIGEEPVSLDMAKRQVRAEGTTADDAYLLELIQSAREHVEAYCGIRVAPAAVRMTFASFDALERLAQAPVQSIVDVRYLDTAGVEQVLDPAAYELVEVDADPLRPRLRLAFNQSWPAIRSAEDAVRVNAVVGYTVVPKPVIRAMLLLIGQWFDNGGVASGQVQELPHAVTALLSNFRR
jgi:uncharacterized phiE125 gp8 family phage protein